MRLRELQLSMTLQAERTLMKERLVRQLGLRGAQAEILEFDSGEAFLGSQAKAAFYRCVSGYLYAWPQWDGGGTGAPEEGCRLHSRFHHHLDRSCTGRFQVRALHYLGSSRFRKTSSPDCWTKCLKGCRSRKNFCQSMSVEVISVCAVVTLCMLSILPI